MGKPEVRPFTSLMTHRCVRAEETDFNSFSENAGLELEKWMMFLTLLLGFGLTLDKSLDLLEYQFPHRLKENRSCFLRLFL